jgi:hypothetical protein
MTETRHSCRATTALVAGAAASVGLEAASRMVAGPAPGPATVLTITARVTSKTRGDDRGGTPRTELLDVCVLEEITDDFGERAARRFVTQFSDALDRRLERLAAGATEGSAWTTFDTAAALAAASSLVGAVPLARAAWAVAHEVVRNRTLPRAETLQRIERLARDTEAALACRHRAGDDGGR